MNNSNPLIPKGSLLEQKNKGRTRVKVAVFCVLSLHLLVLSALLIQGCKDKSPDQASDTGSATNVTTAAPVDTALAAPPSGPASNIVSAPVVLPPTNTYVPPPVTPIQVDTGMKEYVVVKGDILFTIAKKFGVSVKSIENANPGLVPTKMKVGQKLQIPAGGASSGTMASVGGASTPSDSGDTTTYVVKSGDNLTKIAKLNGTTVKAIHAANPNLKGNAIKVGQKLKVPARTAAPATAADTAPIPSSANPVTASATNPALGTAR
jgi:LysM repeat protein